MSLDVSPTSSLTERSDSELIDGTRAGSQDAYAELWRRHANAGRTVARSVTSSLDPDDLVSESFARIYQAIRRGKGPTGAFRPYLFTTVRNTAAAWGRARRETSLDTLDSFEDPDTNEASSIEALDRSLSARAFRSLPTRWQEVLWYTEIEGMSPAEVAPLLGMKANSVSALAYRAREGLREAWIQAHLRSVDDDSEHAFTISRLGSYARGNLAARDTAKLEAHLDACQRCTIVAAEAKEVGSRMALVLLPLVAGTAGAAGYTAWLQTSGHAAAAVVAMPATVTGGTVLTAHLGAHAAGTHAASAALPATTHLGAHAAGATTVGAHVGGGHAAGGAVAAGAGMTGGGASTAAGAGGVASSGLGTGGGAAGSGAVGAAAAGGVGAGVATAGLSGGIITAIIVGVIAAGTAAALVVGPMVFPPSDATDSAVVAEEPVTAPVTPSTPPSAVPTAPPSAVPTPTPSAPVPPPAPLQDDETESETGDPSNDPAQVPPVVPTTPPTGPTAPTDPVDPNVPDAVPAPVISTVDVGGSGMLWPVLSGTAAAGSTIEIILDGSVIQTTTARVPESGSDARAAAIADGRWSTEAMDLGSAGTFELTVRQTLGEDVQNVTTSVTVGAPSIVGITDGQFVLSVVEFFVHGAPGGVVSFTDQSGTRTLQLDDAGVSQPLSTSDRLLDRPTLSVTAIDPLDVERTGPATTLTYFALPILSANEVPTIPTDPIITPTAPAEPAVPAEPAEGEEAPAAPAEPGPEESTDIPAPDAEATTTPEQTEQTPAPVPTPEPASDVPAPAETTE
ncbi:MAG TPA: sigma-70 family RNA polymerase sigma factor [Plantibacter sp.]|uniref:sigma-70 family RNA polymerase sigma factor n=1 Tax=unclassified Plantibacter TaxID=2624265 RepID=UPI002BC89D53|nr:sigma-70 family RNA polymerase sigma factor [Plantibacter sp.]